MDLKSNDSVIELLQLMEGNGQTEQAQEMKRLIACIDSLEEQYSAALKELQSMKRQLAGEPEQRTHNLTSVLQALEKQISEMRVQLEMLREKIITCAKKAVSDFKRVGVSALDTAVSALGVKAMLESIQGKIWDAMERTDASIQKVEDIGHELRSAGGHLKNAGRTVAGKEVQTVDGGQGGRFQSVILAPMRALNSMYAGMDRTIYGALGAVDRLERTAEVNRGKRERPSILQRLKEKRTGTSDRASPVPARKPHEASR